MIHHRYQTEHGTLYLGDVRDALREIPDDSVHCVVTSPPYWGLRDYGLPPTIWGGDPDCEHEWGDDLPGVRRDNQHLDVAVGNKRGGKKHSGANLGIGTRGRYCQHCGAWRGCLGSEPTLDLYVQNMVEVFREVRRVLRPDGTLWLNLGDGRTSGGRTHTRDTDNKHRTVQGAQRRVCTPEGLKPKDLLGMPWRIAFALQEDGWYLRADIVWHKPNPKPESVTDRPTACHEYVFLLSKEPRYYYDGYAVREPCTSGPSDVKKMIEQKPRIGGLTKDLDAPLNAASKHTNLGKKRAVGDPSGRNRRSVWTVATEPFRGAHFATFPRKLVEPCILAGTSAGGCCPHCGKPWRRALLRTGANAANEEGIARMIAAGVPRATANLYVTKDRGQIVSLGFAPNCTCGKRTDCPRCAGRGRKLHNPLAAIDAARERSEATGKPCRPSRRWIPCRACSGPGFPLSEWPEPVPCVVLDPFMGSGTTAAVAVQHGRHWIGTELNPDYVAIAIERITSTQSRLLDCA